MHLHYHFNSKGLFLWSLRTMHVLPRSCRASAFSWWWNPSCFCANLWISLDTTSNCRSLWRSLFLMYQGALTACLSTLFWNLCIMSILLCLVQPQNWIPKYKRVLGFVSIRWVCYGETARSSFQSPNIFFFLYLKSVRLVSFWHRFSIEALRLRSCQDI